MYENRTKNQHFISQAEQRLNALNPKVAKERQRIYEFRVHDRDVPILSLTNDHGQKIECTLSFNDLFSFDTTGGSEVRSNLETLFGDYERDLVLHSTQLLSKLSAKPTPDIKPELLSLFVGKFLNFLRNPNSIQKVLNTFGVAGQYAPSNPSLRKVFEQILSGNRPHQKRICENFKLEDTDYEKWLRILFLLLAKPTKDPLNLFESTVKNIFESHYVIVQVYEYTKQDNRHCCLLSDRGFNVPIPNDLGLAFEFNVSSRAFIRFCFFNPRNFIPPGSRPELVESVMAGVKGLVHVQRIENDLPSLLKYNQLTVFQCASNVYCASTEPLLHL